MDDMTDLPVCLVVPEELRLLPTGCEALDSLLGGGLAVGHLTLVEVPLLEDERTFRAILDAMPWRASVRCVLAQELPSTPSGIIRNVASAGENQLVLVGLHRGELPLAQKFTASVRLRVSGGKVLCLKSVLNANGGQSVQLPQG